MNDSSACISLREEFDGSAATRFVPAINADELPAGRSHALEIAGSNILLCHAGGEFYAVENRCSHQGSPLEGGRIRNCFISCPLHGARFDLRDGTSSDRMARHPIATYPVRVVDGVVEVGVPE